MKTIAQQVSIAESTSTIYQQLEKGVWYRREGNACIKATETEANELNYLIQSGKAIDTNGAIFPTMREANKAKINGGNEYAFVSELGGLYRIEKK